MDSIRFSFFVFPLLASVLSAQVVKSEGPKPQFEVATVRPNKSAEPGASLGPRPGGRLNGTNQTARNLIRNAFNVQPYQLIGGPDWMDSDRFDIVAKAADADLDEKGMMPYPQFMLRLQALLEDRFKMVTRWEKRELPVYALVLVADGKLGPKLKVHAGECDRARGGAPPAPGSAAVNCGTRANVTPTGGKVTGSGIRMETFARNLAGGDWPVCRGQDRPLRLVRSRTRVHSGPISRHDRTVAVHGHAGTTRPETRLAARAG